jgi:serine/threonine protein kinase
MSHLKVRNKNFKHVLDTSFDFETYIKMFRKLKKLGEGGFGQVVLSQHIITKENYAIKSI